MIASDQRLTAVFEMESKEEIFRSFHFHHKSVGKISGKKKVDLHSMQIKHARNSDILCDITDHVSNM